MPLSGRLYFRLIDTKGPAVVVDAGSIALLPTGVGHVVSSVAIDTPSMEVDEFLRMRRDRQNATLRFQGTGGSPQVNFWATQSYWRDYAIDIARWLLPPLLVVSASEQDSPSIHALASALEKLGRENRDETPILVNQITNTLIQTIVARHLSTSHSVDSIYDAAMAMTGRSVDSLDVAIARTGLTTRTFARRFQQMTGETPQSYIRVQRLRRAATLLEAGMLSVAEVAEACGYLSVTSFTKAFRNEYRCAPSQWRSRITTNMHREGPLL
jgi:AraC-like DNA-binding protein